MEAQLQMMQERFNAEGMSQNGSNTQQYVSPRSVEHAHEAYQEVDFQEDEAYEHIENNDAVDVGEYLFVDRRNAAPTMQSPSIAAVPMHPQQCSRTDASPAVQPNVASKSAQPQLAKPTQTKVAKSAQAVNVNVHRSRSHDEYIRKDVILYELVRNSAVAKGTIVSVNPKKTLGGVALGKHYCEVVVNFVMKRDAILPRPYAGVEKMSDANNLQVAWPYNRLKFDKASASNHGTSVSGRGNAQLPGAAGQAGGCGGGGGGGAAHHRAGRP